MEENLTPNPKPIGTYSPLALAYIGDSVYDLIIKTMVLEKGNKSAQSLHKTVTGLVNATVQSEMSEALKEVWTEEEAEVFRRGRNAKSYTTAKNAAVSDYRRATGFEAVIGYLYLTGGVNRAQELVLEGLGRIGRLKETEEVSD